MKKIFTIITAFVVCISSFAQGWSTKHVCADPLKGNNEYNMYTYSKGVASFTYYDTYKDYVEVTLTSGTFDYSFEYKHVSIIVGLYKDGVLTERMLFSVDVDNIYVPKTIYASSWTNPGKGEKIINCLESGGVVRFIIPRDGDEDLDFSVPARVK